MNKLEFFKNRKINSAEPVWVYRNLHRQRVSYSLRQKGMVVAHATELNLKDCKFIVNRKSRNNIRETGRKVVHAFVKGFISEEDNNIFHKVFYNPKTVDGFTIVSTNAIIEKATHVKFNEYGVFIS